MKRFAKTISLAACLVFLCGVTAMAADHVTVESKTVLPNAAGVSLGVFISNDQGATGMVIPLEFREINAGSYMTTAFTNGILATGRMQTSPLGPGGTPPASVTLRKYPAPGGAPCGGNNTYTTSAAQIDFATPDGTMLATVSQGDPNAGDDIDMDPGSDPAGFPSYGFTFNVTGVQGQFECDTMCVRPANHLVYTNINTVAVQMTFTKGIVTIFQPPNACPVASIDNAVVNATVGSAANNDADGIDPEGDAISFCLVSGPGAVNAASGAWTYTPLCSDIPSFQVTIEATDKGCGNCGQASSVSFTVNVSPAALALGCSDVSAHWAGADASQQLNASGGCPPYSYSVVSGPGSVDAGGVWSYDQGCQDLGASAVTVRVTDSQQGTDDCSFTLNVTNTAPICDPSVPAATLAPQGVPTVIDLGALSQGDGDALTYTYNGGLPAPWGAGIVGDQFSATRPGGDGASYTVSYTVSDGCESIDCEFDLIFENPCIAVVGPGGEAYECALNGEQAQACIVAEPGALPGDAGGFDLLICYDQSGLSFLGATGGPAGWEYFTYRTGMFGGNCGGGCPDGFVRLVSIAEMNNGVNVDPAVFDLDGVTLACLTFFVTSDRNFINTCLHVGFCSYDCGDNTFSDVSGDIVWTPRDGVLLGPNYGCPDDPKVDYLPEVSYCGGAICVCEPPDDRGDLNLNGIANEIGDAVLYTNYFIYGPSVWSNLYANSQILASDINDDVIVLTVADLIYLIRIITGDESPFPPGTGSGSPKLSPYANSVDVTTEISNGAVNVRTSSSVEIGAALLVYRYSDMTVGTPVLANNSGLEIRSRAENGELRVLISQSVESASSRLTAGANSLVTIPVNGNGTIEMVESQFSDYNGALLTVNSASAALPTEFALLQNYPNPFNAGTVIPVALKSYSNYELTIYNVAGQVVRTFSGEGEGLVNVAWNGRSADGNEVASGMYFYRVSTPHFTATKKMVLMK